MREAVERDTHDERRAQIDRNIAEGYTRIPQKPDPISVDHHSRVASDVPLDRNDGMPAECVLNVANAETIRKVYFAEPVCRLDEAKVRRVCDVLSTAIECS